MVLKYQQPFAQTDQATDGWGSWAGGREQAHRGVDYQPGDGASIPAVATGSVSYNNWNSALGNVLVIAHPDGMYSGYCHMKFASPLAVGAAVTRGSIVGTVGNTGTASRASHLHLTMTYTADGTWNNVDISVTTDPYAFINARLNGDDPGTTNPLQEEDDMYILVRGQGTPMVYLSNMIIRRPIATEPELAGVQWWLGQRGISDTSVKVVDDVAAFGVVVKP